MNNPDIPYAPRKAVNTLVDDAVVAASRQVTVLDPDSLPLRARELVLKSVDQGISAVLNDIDNLIRELQEMKTKVIADAGLCKEVIGNHFNMQAGAIDHAAQIRRNMQYLSNGGPPEPLDTEDGAPGQK